MWIYGAHDTRTVEQLQRCVAAEEGAVGVLCADGHVGYSMPIGGVVAYKDHVSPSGVGYDIACGNMAVRTDLMVGDVERDLPRIADEIQRRISFGVGRKNSEPVIDHPVFDRIAQSTTQRHLLLMASEQLGTVGSGNHYIDIFRDGQARIWVGVHFGSRGLGHKTATGFLNLAAGRSFDARGGQEDMDAPPTLIDVHTDLGSDYFEAMNIAGEYAYAGREAVVGKVLEILGADAIETIHNHHNFTWKETHNGQDMFVVRKGATPAWPGQLGFVGGSMGDISVILRGKDSLESPRALYSTVHGAGRVMSRTQAAGKQRWVKGVWQCGMRECRFTAPLRDFQRGPQNALPQCPACGAKMVQMRGKQLERTGGCVDFNDEKAKLIARGIILRGAGADEAPPVYRSLRSVLADHADTIEILHTLTPLVVVMAGGDEFDPYKD